MLYSRQICYYTYFVLSDRLLPDAWSYAYRWSYRTDTELKSFMVQILHAQQNNSKDSDHKIIGRSPIHYTVPLEEWHNMQYLA